MPTIWTIPANGIQPQSGPGMDLVGCHIAIVNDAFGQHYAFEFPNGQIIVQTPGSTLPSIPFNFPTFNTGFRGHTAKDWYIRVTSGGPNAQQLGGLAGNNSFAERVNPADADPDTFTAQAGVGVDPDDETEKDKGAAASASPK